MYKGFHFWFSGCGLVNQNFIISLDVTKCFIKDDKKHSCFILDQRNHCEMSSFVETKAISVMKNKNTSGRFIT